MDRDTRVTEFVADNASLSAENAALRARVAELNEQIAVLVGKIADLEKRLGRDSSNSSKQAAWVGLLAVLASGWGSPVMSAMAAATSSRRALV